VGIGRPGSGIRRHSPLKFYGLTSGGSRVIIKSYPPQRSAENTRIREERGTGNRNFGWGGGVWKGKRISPKLISKAIRVPIRVQMPMPGLND